MDDYDKDAVVNRDDPIPVVSVTAAQDRQDSPDGQKSSKQGIINKALSATGLKDKLENVASNHGGDPSSIQDRLFNTLLTQIIPHDTQDSDNGSGNIDRRSRTYVDRPGFSIALMSNNFRRFNARIGVAFVFQNRLIRLFSWRAPTQTLSFLAIYTFLCLDPYLLAVLPLAAYLFFIMVPAFLARHPPPPSAPHTDIYSMQGPPIAPPHSIKPAHELSKDFFRNMRDLQNSMEDFSAIHDQIVKTLAPPTNFSNEPLSSAIFLFLFTACCVLFIASHIVPWRAILLVAGWTITALGHPKAQAILLTEENKDVIRPHSASAQNSVDAWITSDIVLDAAPETREVEIFELQRRNTRGTTSSIEEWEPWVFSPSPYDPLSPARISGDRPRGTRFFEDVKPPSGWEWSDKKWTLDLGSREWVEERMITGVAVEVEGERWVYDLPRREEGTGEEMGSPDGNGKGKAREMGRKVDWEEGSGLGKKGEWRRRRWVRLVKRKVLSARGS